MRRHLTQPVVWFAVVFLVPFLWLGPVSATAQDGYVNENEFPPEEELFEEDMEALEGQSVAVPGEPVRSRGIKGNTIAIPVAEFASDGDNPEGYFKSFSQGYLRGEDDGACLSAPIIFPKGAKKFRWIRIYAWDDNPTRTTNFRLYAMRMKSASNEFLGSVRTEDTTEVERYEIVPDTSRVAEISSGRTYTLTMCVYEDIYVYGALVRYTD